MKQSIKFSVVAKWLVFLGVVLGIGYLVFFKEPATSQSQAEWYTYVIPIVIIVISIITLVLILSKSSKKQTTTNTNNLQNNQNTPAPATTNKSLKTFWDKHKLSVLGVGIGMGIFVGLSLLYISLGYHPQSVFIAITIFALLLVGGIIGAGKFNHTIRDRSVNFLVWLTVIAIVFGIGAYVFSPEQPSYSQQATQATVTPSKKTVTLEPGASTKKIEAQGSKTFWEIHPELMMMNSSTSTWVLLTEIKDRDDNASWYRFKNVGKKPITFQYWFE